MIRADKLDVDRALVLGIDLQTALLPSIHHSADVIAQGCKLLAGVRVLELPVLATEQYPKGIGATEPKVRAALDAAGAVLLEKLTFSAVDEPSVREELRRIDCPQVIVLGIEAHVCVQQSVLDLLAQDYQVFVCADAVGSRSPLDYERALARMQQAGAAVTTVESVLFELCHRCDTARFKALLPAIKATPPVGVE